MLSFDHTAARQKVPVVILCGVDARARTEAIEWILDGRGQQWAVISNETDGPAFEASCVERVAGQMVPHAIGCLCCVTRSGLVSSLRRLFAMRSQGHAGFDYVIIETLPDYDPAPVVQTLLNNPLVTEYFCLDSVVSVMAPGGFEALERSRYGFKQLAVSDRIIVDERVAASDRLKARIKALAPAADLIRPDHANPSEAVLGAGLEACLLRGDIEGWLGRSRYAASDDLEHGLFAFSVAFDEPLDWDAFHAWLNAGTQMNGDIMFRTKAVIQLAGLDGPVVINGAQHVYQPPQILTDIRFDTSKLLMITNDLDKSAIEQSLREDLPQFARINTERAERARRAALDPSIPL
ncbi:MAG: GTP-binding protein [Pseudomonadota bacterium]